MRKPRYPGIVRPRLVTYVHPQLKDLIEAAAQRAVVSVSDWLAGLAAKELKWKAKEN